MRNQSDLPLPDETRIVSSLRPLDLITRYRSRHSIPRILLLCCFGLTLLCCDQGFAANPAIDVECFTEPYRRIDVAAPEMGVLAEIRVAEGDIIAEQQILARLDDRVLTKALEVARAAKSASGSLRAALSELQSTRDQLEGYRSLRRNEHATDRELQRATTAVAVADAKVQVVRDELLVRQTEFERTQAQLENRRIKSPIGGTVIEIRKDVGEFVSPTDPVIMTIVDLSQLKAIFSVPHSYAAKLRVGQVASLVIGARTRGTGIIEFVSPAADPQSGTVRVKFRIQNPDSSLPCGILCRWDGNAADTEQHLSQSAPGSRR